MRRSYLGQNYLFITVFHNQQVFHVNQYNEERISHISTQSKVLLVTNQPSWTEGFVKKNMLYDETDFMQLGQSDQEAFNVMEFGKTETAAYSTWPTRENPYHYQYGGIWLELKQEMTNYER